jgi:hypothetical protein
MVVAVGIELQARTGLVGDVTELGNKIAVGTVSPLNGNLKKLGFCKAAVTLKNISPL